MTTVHQVAADFVDLPPTDPEAAVPFRYAEAEKLVTLLDQAGYGELDVSDWLGVLPIGGGLPAAKAASFALASFFSFGELLSQAGDKVFNDACQSLTARLSGHQQDGPVRMDARVHILTGARWGLDRQTTLRSSCPSMRDRYCGTHISMSVIIPRLNDGIDAIVWSSEELEGIVTAIDAGFWYYSQMVKQDTARLLNGFQSRRDVVCQEPHRYTPWPSRAMDDLPAPGRRFQIRSRSLRLKPRNWADQPPGASRGRRPPGPAGS